MRRMFYYCAKICNGMNLYDVADKDSPPGKPVLVLTPAELEQELMECWNAARSGSPNSREFKTFEDWQKGRKG